jgi:hypothetical protein
VQGETVCFVFFGPSPCGEPARGGFVGRFAVGGFAVVVGLGRRERWWWWFILGWGLKRG